ncbi:MAG: hypothetical protein VKK62_09775 [Synechococcaceae cyanobacterium]|nr:hypothetical protein [Synechococcaceae cyanobacterium]
MAALLLITLVVVGLTHWLLDPLIHLGTGLAQAGWLAGLALIGVVWLFLGGEGPD